MQRSGTFIRQLRDAMTTEPADPPQFVGTDRMGRPIRVGDRVRYGTPRGKAVYEGRVMRRRADPRWARDPRGNPQARTGWLDVRRDDGFEASVRPSACAVIQP